MGSLLLAVFAGVALAPPSGARVTAQQVGPIAILPFADEVGMRGALARFATLRLAQSLAQRGYPIVPAADVERAIRETGGRAADLRTIAGASEVARRAGARLFITGSLIRADVDPARPPLTPDEIPEGPPAATVVLAIHLGSAVVPGLPMRTEVHGYDQGGLPLLRAAELAIADFVRRFPDLLRRIPTS
ncbi:MAG: hypothetical protein QN122_08635 [Armatimonadota bacterium]|nr:hypothetical protein [Armatimonadota bacterium]MDR7478308.1 hypothetical protein [Armatimonadota bacterium]MDR7487249.1 hypothetical protein [Armatimonadota bacterium]MDR7491503.1 hypothetical protein [Armatimonadota bacterium]MDR7501200.1 hypothetical protein [Armatimonadota bacterium]